MAAQTCGIAGNDEIDGRIRQRRCFLRHAGDADPAGDIDVALVRFKLTLDRRKQAGLATAIAPDHADPATRVQGKVDTGQQQVLATPQGKVSEGNHEGADYSRGVAGFLAEYPARSGGCSMRMPMQSGRVDCGRGLHARSRQAAVSADVDAFQYGNGQPRSRLKPPMLQCCRPTTTPQRSRPWSGPVARQKPGGNGDAERRHQQGQQPVSWRDRCRAAGTEHLCRRNPRTGSSTQCGCLATGTGTLAESRARLPRRNQPPGRQETGKCR